MGEILLEKSEKKEGFSVIRKGLILTTRSSGFGLKSEFIPFIKAMFSSKEIYDEIFSFFVSGNFIEVSADEVKFMAK